MAETSPHNTDKLVAVAANSDDSESDISMSDATDDESEAPPIISTVGSRKRRHAAEEEEFSGHHGENATKRLKGDPGLSGLYTSMGHLHEDKSLLPAEIWHNIFVFTPPRLLGSLLQVNKLFNSYLDPSSTVNKPAIAPLSTSVAKSLDPDSIWQTSRVRFRPGMPTPLAGFSELDMWKLACQKSCQFCNAKPVLDTTPTDRWHSGPGGKGVRTIWSFAIRTCGSCLINNSVREYELLVSTTVPSLLIPALPFVFLTNENHIISHASLENGLPPNTQITRYFFKPHVEDMKLEFSKAKEMGTAAAEEWIKGLDDLGKDRRNDAVRWERWESLGGVQRMCTSEPNEKIAVGLPNMSQPSSGPSQSVLNSAASGIKLAQQGNDRPSSAVKVPSQLPPAVPASFSASNAPGFNPLPLPPPNGFGQPARNGPQRTKEEAAELKAARKMEIERRAKMLSPPLSAAVLAHMSSFQAALQIIKPMDDSAWELLKPRLLSQRAEAEQREKDRVVQTRVLQEVVDERHHLPHDQQPKESEREWDDVQAPLRARLGGFADEIIRDGWASGTKVTDNNSPQFAAEVLVYVRKRFYAEIAKDDAAARAAGQEPKADPPNGPYTQKLILENMKWVFDTRIKPHTEQYRKELFLCNGCENNPKFYGFEGVIQHYAAKHTSSLSVGSIVVHWKAEWPECPPFHPDPTQIKAAPWALPSSTSYSSAGLPAHSGYGRAGYPAASVSMPNQSSNPLVYQPPYGQKTFGDSYNGSQNGFQNQNQALQSSQYPGQTYPQPYQAAQKDYAPQRFGAHFHGAQPGYDSPHTAQIYPNPPDQMGVSNGYPHPGGKFASQQMPADPRFPPHQGGNNFAPGLLNGAAQHDPAYMNQLEFVARTARDIWNSTTGIKEMPGSVRVYVIIHHVINRSKGQFLSEPPLLMFIDGLSNVKEMRPVRNVNGLTCKTCNSDPSQAVSSDKKSFSLPQLFNHFQAHHIASQPEGVALAPYWVTDMVQLPEMSKISALLYTSGMDDNKIKLVADIFPMAFPSPLPRVEAARTAVAQSENYHRNNKFIGRAKNGKEHRHETPAPMAASDAAAIRYENLHQSPYDDHDGKRSSMPLKSDDEYTPHNPQGGRIFTETAPMYRQADELEQRGRDGAYDPRTAGNYAQDQRDGVLQLQSAVAHLRGKKHSAKANVAMMASRDQAKQARNGMEDRNVNEIPLARHPEKLAREAEEQERLQEEALRASWKAERVDSVRRMYQPSSERHRDGHYNEREDVDNNALGVLRTVSPERLSNTRPAQTVHDRYPGQARHEIPHEYDERHTAGTKGPQHPRERSPELVDHRYKLNNVVYREERQLSHGSGRGIAPARYSRYESMRSENDRARSRSPVYVKVGSQPGPYRERSPVLQPCQPESSYRGHTPQGNMQEIAYERAPRPDYYYADGPRARQPPPQYAEPCEFIRVADPVNGDYMIRRPLPARRESVYAPYEEDPYDRQPAYDTREPVYETHDPVYETRAPVELRAAVSRSDPAYYEEYDPRNPAPPPTSLRQARY